MATKTGFPQTDVDNDAVGTGIWFTLDGNARAYVANYDYIRRLISAARSRNCTAVSVERPSGYRWPAFRCRTFLYGERW
jgi:hypothetical protein